jgi:CheY-like chemotaxis protein
MEAVGAKMLLVVDDDEDIRESVRFVLEEEGYEVVTASNGAHALEQLRQGPRPCLILLDLMMPVMSGWDFMAEQRKDAALADIPVVVITADADAREQALSLRAAGLVKKPFKLARLVEAIEQHAHPPRREAGR